VLGCSKSTASRLRAGSYGCDGDLPARYGAMVAIIERQRQEAPSLGEICRSCPREDCTGCRIAEIHDAPTVGQEVRK